MRTNQCLANPMVEKKKDNTCLSELWRICVAVDFPQDYPVVFTVSISLRFNIDILLKVVRAFKLCCSLV